MQPAHYPSDDRTVILAGDDVWNARLPLTDAVESQPSLVGRVNDAPWLPDQTHQNPLLTAAAPLLSELVHLRDPHIEHEPADILRVTLQAGIEQFDQHCLTMGLTAANRQAARYVLCTALDEAVLATRWGNESDWSNYSLLSVFHQETFGGERFFLLLTRLSQDTVQHLDLLELMLVCLSLGFEGRYRLQPRGQAELERIRKRLHSALQQHRGVPDMTLAPTCAQSRPAILPRPTSRWLIGAATASCLAALFMTFNHHLEQHRNAALQPYLSSSVTDANSPGADQ